MKVNAQKNRDWGLQHSLGFIIAIMETSSEQDRNQTGLIRLNLDLSTVKLTLHSSAVFNMKSMNIRSIHLEIQLVLEMHKNILHMNFVAKMDQFTLSSLSGMNVIICKIEKIYN